MVYKFGKRVYDFSSRTHIMGILNITPDSFSDGGNLYNGNILAGKITEIALKMEKDGADFLDIGGESTRPGAKKISVNDELERVIPTIEILSKKISIPISIDTYKCEVAEEALKAGAVIVNDISGFRFDQKMPEITSRYDASCILMHIKGTPKDMQKKPEYNNVVEEVYEYLLESSRLAEKAGIKQIILDPGIGFGKTFEHNTELIKNLDKIRKTGYPVLVGLSRKSFIAKIYESTVDERTEGTIASNTAAIFYGANIIRVHDVLMNKRAALTADIFKK